MNYFGLFFSFTLPGIIIGIMIAAAAAEGVFAAGARTADFSRSGLYHLPQKHSQTAAKWDVQGKQTERG